MAKVLVSVPDRFLEKIDEVAQNEQRTRSELIREALRNYMRRNTMFDRARTEKHAELLDNLLD